MPEIPDLVVRKRNGEPLFDWMADLSRFLYAEGVTANAAAYGKAGGGKSGKFGEAIWDRLDLLVEIKEVIESNLISGGSEYTAKGLLIQLKLFFAFVQKHDLPLSLEDLEQTYLTWAEHLFAQSMNKNSKTTKASAYQIALTLSALFSSILGLSRYRSLIKKTRLKPPRKGRKALGLKAEKQDLESTFELGQFMVCLCAGLSPEAILGPLPLQVPIKIRGREDFNVRFSRSRTSTDDWLAAPRETWSETQKQVARRALPARDPVSSIEGTWRTELVNVRVGAELFVFVAQTGINVAQALELKRKKLKYRALGDSWQIRAYKKRKGGEVTFSVYKDYRPFLKQYLAFLDYFFPHSDLLFPKMKFRTAEVSETPITNNMIVRKVALKHGVPYVPLSKIRNTRVNWLLRRSGDEDQTADVAQHTKKVLLDKYEKPSQQRSMAEITRFWNAHDPIKKGNLKGSLIASQCDAKPEAVEKKPPSVADPDCVTPSGCLWCKRFRDVDSFDYVWSLTSFRYLKTLEAGSLVGKEKAPADITIERITQKTNWFKESSDVRAQWVEESEERIEEGDFHPNWTSLIEFLEDA